MAFGDGTFGFGYAEDPRELAREMEVAHAMGVCHECGFADGLHNEGACSQWRDAEEDEIEDERPVGDRYF